MSSSARRWGRFLAVWLGRSLAVALVLAFVTGCGESDAKTYGALEVRDALRQHGFDVDVLSENEREFGNVFPDALPGGTRDVVAYRGGLVPPGGQAHLYEFVITAVILSSEERASCHEPDEITTCLKKGNVVVVVRSSVANAAREALDDLD